MRQEDKDLLFLLFKDLCARLPYGVKAQVKINVKYSDAHKPNSETWIGDICGIIKNKTYIAWVYSFITIYPCGPEQNICSISECKPYLRPMSSMTKEEIEECHQLQQDTIHVTFDEYDKEYEKIIDLPYFKSLVEFYNSHHLDYCGFIEKGLALEAPKDMYNFNKNEK